MKQLNKKSLLFVIALIVLAIAANSLVFAQVSPRLTTVGTGAGTCTEAAFETALANAPDGDTIDFNCGGAATITLTEAAPTDTAGVPTITKNLTIDGGEEITFSGGYNGVSTATGTRLFVIGPNVTVSFIGVTFQNGNTTNAELGGNGAAIFTEGNVNISRSTFKNSIAGRGSAIAIDDNPAAPTPIVNIFQSAFVNNVATARSVIYVAGGELNVANSTFSGNVANTEAGSILRTTGAAGTVLNFTNVTISAPATVLFAVNQTLNLRNSIISSTATALCDAGSPAGINDAGGNVNFGGGTCTGLTAPASTADPQLGTLTADFVPYLPIGTSSSALDLVTVASDAYLSTASNSLFSAGAAVAVDQTGAARPLGTGKDAGAIEAAGSPATNTPIPPTNTPVPPTNTPGGPTETATATTAPVPGAFNLLSPENNAVINDPSEVTAITWTLSTGATSYEFVLIKTSDNVRLGEVARVPVLAENCGDTPGVCTLTVGADVQALLTDGTYTWSVTASNADGTTEATNSPFTFTVSTSAQELVLNGGFETLGANGKPDIAPWTIKNESGDKGKCNKPENGKVFAYSGECAFRFKGVPGDKAKLSQNIDPTLAAEGDVLTVSAAVKSNVTPGKLITLKLEYVDPTAGLNNDGKDKAVIEVTGPTLNEDYQIFNVALTVADTPTEIKVQLKGKAESGKTYVDDVSVIAQPTVGTVAPLPLPLP